MKRVLTAVGIIFGVLMLAGCGVAVPDTKGMTADQAASAIAVSGFEVGSVTYDEKAIGAAGAIVAQQPASGERAKQGSLVTLTVAGFPPVPTPDLGGFDRSKAEAVINAVGLATGEVTESYDSSAPAGLLISQVPSAGIVAAKGSEVTFVVSKGPKPIEVPNVKGKTQAKATKTLKDAGFKVKAEMKNDDAKRGTVIA